MLSLKSNKLLRNTFPRFETRQIYNISYIGSKAVEWRLRGCSSGDALTKTLSPIELCDHNGFT